MFFMNINEALKDWGLNDKEAKVYLATLQLGLSRVNDIAKKAGILRETTYFVLNSLIQKGLVGYVLKSGVKFFEAADPGKFISILKEKETKMKEILPNLEEIKKSIIEKPVVELYEGKEGLKTILDDIIKTKQPMWAYANYKKTFVNLVHLVISRSLWSVSSISLSSWDIGFLNEDAGWGRYAPGGGLLGGNLLKETGDELVPDFLALKSMN